MNWEYAFLLLLGYTMLREVIYTINTHRLLDKYNSRSFFEYRQAQDLGKKRDKVVVQLPPDDVEDLSRI